MVNRFSIIYGATTRFVAPVGETKLKLTEQPEGDQVFFRRKLGGAIVLKGDDFRFLYAIEQSGSRCDEIFFVWERACSEDAAWAVHFAGVFGAGDAKWKPSQCQVTFTPKTDDAYRVFLENYARDHNVLAVTNTVSTIGRLETDDTFEFREINVGEIGDQADDQTWATFLTLTSWVSGSFANGVRNKTEIIYRLRTVRDLVNGQPVDLSDKGWALLSSDATKAYYAKAPDVYAFETYEIKNWSDWNRFPDLKLVPAGSAYDSAKYVSLNANGANSGACGRGLRLRTYLADKRCYDILWEFGTFTFTRNRRLLEVIRYLIRQAAPDLEPQTDEELSGFFTAAVNPVTGQPNKVRDPLLGQLSDLKRYRSTEAATKGMLSFRDLAADLRAVLDVRWFVNAKRKLQFEHVSYFGTAAIFDATVVKWAKATAGSDGFEYLRAKMPRFEKLSFGIGQNEPFLEAEIEYFGACVVKDEGEDTTTISVSRLTADIEGVMISGASFPDAGFVLISQDGTGVIPKETPPNAGRLYLNGHLSATAVFETYHREGRVMPSGFLNGKTVFFASTARTKKQDDFALKLCCDAVDPAGRFVSTVGKDGRAAQLTYDFDGSVTFSLVHDAFTGTGSVVLGAQFDESFDQSFTS